MPKSWYQQTSCPIIAEQAAVNSVAQQVTIARIRPVKTPLVLALSAYNSKTSTVTSIFLLANCNQYGKMQLLQSLKKFCEGGSQPP